jgi:hypothetical protein
MFGFQPSHPLLHLPTSRLGLIALTLHLHKSSLQLLKPCLSILSLGVQMLEARTHPVMLLCTLLMAAFVFLVVMAAFAFLILMAAIVFLILMAAIVFLILMATFRVPGKAPETLHPLRDASMFGFQPGHAFLHLPTSRLGLIAITLHLYISSLQLLKPCLSILSLGVQMLEARTHPVMLLCTLVMATIVFLIVMPAFAFLIVMPAFAFLIVMTAIVFLIVMAVFAFLIVMPAIVFLILMTAFAFPIVMSAFVFLVVMAAIVFLIVMAAIVFLIVMAVFAFLIVMATIVFLIVMPAFAFLIVMTAIVFLVMMPAFVFSMFLALVLTCLPARLIMTAFAISVSFVMTTCAMCMGMLRQGLGLMMEFLPGLRPQVFHTIPSDMHPVQLLFQCHTLGLIPRCLDLHLKVHLLELQFMDMPGQFTVGIEHGLDLDLDDLGLDLMRQVLVGVGFGQAGCGKHQANHDWEHVETFHDS